MAASRFAAGPAGCDWGGELAGVGNMSWRARSVGESGRVGVLRVWNIQVESVSSAVWVKHLARVSSHPQSLLWYSSGSWYVVVMVS
jgi:hypothetical protein